MVLPQGSNLLPFSSSKFYDMIFAQSTSSDDFSVMILYDPCLYTLFMILVIIVHNLSLSASGQQIRSQMTQPPHIARAHTLFKLQTKTLMYSHRYITFSKVVQIIKCTCTVFIDNFRNVSTNSSI